MLLGT
jgi:hypothetical protein